MPLLYLYLSDFRHIPNDSIDNYLRGDNAYYRPFSMLALWLYFWFVCATWADPHAQFRNFVMHVPILWSWSRRRVFYVFYVGSAGRSGVCHSHASDAWKSRKNRPACGFGMAEMSLYSFSHYSHLSGKTSQMKAECNYLMPAPAVEVRAIFKGFSCLLGLF